MAIHLKQCCISYFISHGLEGGQNHVTLPIVATLDLVLTLTWSHHLETFTNWRDDIDNGSDSLMLKILSMVKHFDSLDLKLHIATSFFILQLMKHIGYIPPNTSDEDKSLMFVVICHYYAAVK